MGKTVLMSHVVAQLHAVRKSNEILSYYFCRVDNEASLSARNILGSLARQMIDTQIDQSNYETLLALEESSRDLSANDVISFLLYRLEANKKYYVILDGLDECQDHQIKQWDRLWLSSAAVVLKGSKSSAQAGLALKGNCSNRKTAVYSHCE